MLQRVVVLGALGEVGRLISGSLQERCIPVIGVDLHPHPVSIGDEFLQGDAVNPGPELVAQLQQADCIFVALPEDAAVASAAALAGLLPNDALWVDTLSIKGPIARLLEPQRSRLQILSINPMFAPSLGWPGRPVACVVLAPGAKVDFMLNLLRSFGSSTELLSASEHDRITASIQVATHAAAIAFGASLLDSGFDVNTAARLATPPHQLLLALVRRIVSQNPEVYWEIQKDHPLGAQTRRHLIKALETVDQAVRNGDQVGFSTILRSIKQALSSQDSTIRGWAERFFSK